ncbi:MAG: integrin [Verrucomicrobiae bacterium]|nr:integrin [Verrucomicrobiae bacterium]
MSPFHRTFLAALSGSLLAGSVRAEVVPDAYVKASNTGSEDNFGFSMAISGDTLVIGAPGEASSGIGPNDGQADDSRSGSGAVYVYARSGGAWSLQAYLKASNPGAGDGFGTSVAIDGDTLIVGAPGEDSNATGVNGAQGNNSANNAGAAYVFFRLGSIWGQQAYLKASNTSPTSIQRFGASVSVSGDLAVVGSPDESSSSQGVGGDQNNQGASNAGAAYVFARDGFTWSQQAYIKASNTGDGDQFGSTVALSGLTLAVAARGEDSNATGVNGLQNNNASTDAGAVYVFAFANNTWTQQAYLKASNTGTGDRFGHSLALDGNTLLVGARDEDGANAGPNAAGSNNGAAEAGAAYVFVREGNLWSQQASLKSSRPIAGDRFGFSVDLSGNTAIVGAVGEDRSATGVGGDQINGTASNSGAAYLFSRTGSAWSESAYLKASNTGASDCFGSSVAHDGEFSAVGAAAIFLTGDFSEILFGEDSAATGIDGDGSDNSADDSGAAYTFRSLPSPALVPRLSARGETLLRVVRPRVTLRGTSTNADVVFFQSDGSGFRKIKGRVSPWKIPLRLEKARTVVKVRATGPGGTSRILKFVVIRSSG